MNAEPQQVLDQYLRGYADSGGTELQASGMRPASVRPAARLDEGGADDSGAGIDHRSAADRLTQLEIGMMPGADRRDEKRERVPCNRPRRADPHQP